MDDQGGKVLTVTAASIGGTILLFICLIAYLIAQPFSWFSDKSDLWTLRQEYQGGGSGAALANVALNEYEQYGGTACGSNYWPGGAQDWCCDFVYWCADQLGYVGQDNLFGPWTSYCPTAVSQLYHAGAAIYYPTDGIVPQAGDIIFFSSHYGRAGKASDGVSDYAAHIGIVVEGTTYTVTIIEGNTGGGGPSRSKLSKNTYSLTGASWGSTYILSFFRPSYPSGDGLDGPFYFSMSQPDPSYTGHSVTGLTNQQIANIKNTIYGEYGSDLGGAICVAQSIRDNVDRSGSITYDNFITACSYDGGKTSRSASVYNTAIVQAAFDYVFNQGGSAVQHPIYCFYTPLGNLQTDADYQRLFLKPLEFVWQVGSARFFSWEV